MSPKWGPFFSISRKIGRARHWQLHLCLDVDRFTAGAFLFAHLGGLRTEHPDCPDAHAAGGDVGGDRASCNIFGGRKSATEPEALRGAFRAKGAPRAKSPQSAGSPRRSRGRLVNASRLGGRPWHGATKAHGLCCVEVRDSAGDSSRRVPG